MTIYQVRRRVACYVTRATDRGRELLVFDHAEDDPDDPSGTQVPAGGRLPFSALAEDAVRETEEETGLSGLVFVRALGAVQVAAGEPGGPSVTDYVHLEAPADSPASWEHTVSGGDDDGLVFSCRWEPLPLTLRLAGEQDAFLAELAG